MSLYQRSSFSAENTPITVVPAFSSTAPLPLLSSPHTTTTIGPFVAGMPVTVPLWTAKLLHSKQLAQIQIPDWLHVDRLKAALLEEQRHTTLTSTHLPYFYFEIARSLTAILNQQQSSSEGMSSGSSSGGSGGGGGHQQAALVILQDLMAVRLDKLRQNFHELSKETLANVPVNDQYYDYTKDALPIIEVNGIASIELNKLGPFLQRAFSDYGYLHYKSPEEGETKGEGGSGSGLNSEESISGNTTSKKVAVARSRLRKFRQ